jgi:hypothetical protein
MYLDRARSAVKSFTTYLNTSTGGFAGITDVNNVNTAQYDETQSFWFAEVLKYLCVFFARPSWVGVDRRRCSYLTFDDPSHISLNNCEYFMSYNLEWRLNLIDHRRFQHGSSPVHGPGSEEHLRKWPTATVNHQGFVNQPGPIPLPSPRPNIITDITGIVGDVLGLMA